MDPAAVRMQEDASVLKSAIGKNQRGTDGPYLRTMFHAQESFEPIRSQDLDVVVEKEQVLSGGTVCTLIT